MLFIIDKKAQTIEGMKVTKEGIDFGEAGTIRKDHVFACLHCEELKNITLIVMGNPVSQVTLVFDTKELFQEAKSTLVMEYPEMDVSEQNRKINGYAAAIVAKLKEGIVTGIVDTKEKDDIKECPVCGMQCDKDATYCMECGANL